jgi:uncharacterized membrane protein
MNENHMKDKRNYQFVQFLLDVFGVFTLYLVAISVITGISETIEHPVNRQGMVIRNPYTFIVWGGVGLIIYLAGIIVPIVFAKRTKLNQKQFDMWVYAVLLVRMLVMFSLFNFMSIHISFIMRNPQVFDPYILLNAVLIAIIIRFTQFRIRKAEPKKEGTIKITFTED